MRKRTSKKRTLRHNMQGNCVHTDTSTSLAFNHFNHKHGCRLSLQNVDGNLHYTKYRTRAL
jgi:hypothetical protein